MNKEFMERKVSGRAGSIWKKGAVCVLVLILLLTACGGASNKSSREYDGAAESQYTAAESRDFSAEEDAEPDEDMFYASESAVEPDAEANGSSDMGQSASGSTDEADPDISAEEGSQSANRKIVYS